MTDDDRLDPALLATYEVPEPAVDLADRLMARLSPVSRRARWPYAVAGLVAAAAILIVVIHGQSRPTKSTGASTATARTTEKLGDRGVAVVEAGGAITWEIVANAVRVRQDRGDVFYRVERAAETFEVTTAQAVVRVRGTCFRVVLDPYGTTVTVDEGTVEIGNARGQIIVTAGERASATNDAPPRMLSVATLVTPPIAAATQAELLVRDRAQRERIAELEAQVAGAARTAEAIAQRARRPFDMNHDELVKLAEHCLVPHDIEPIAGSTVMDTILERGAQKVGLTEEERAAVARVIERTQPAYQTGLQRLYTELTGETGAALDPTTLITEISQKSPNAETAVAYQRIAAERVAGKVRPTADGKSSVIERYVRFAIASSDAFETQLASEIGSDRARAFRRTWGMLTLAPGCPK